MEAATEQVCPRLTSEPHEKLPESRRRALNLKLPPLTRTRLTVTLLDSFVMAGWRPSSYLHGAASSAQKGLDTLGVQADHRPAAPVRGLPTPFKAA